MTEEPSTLYAKLLGETASISWKELEPFFAKGALLWVDPSLDLIAAAEAVATDEGEKVAAWLAEDKVAAVGCGGFAVDPDPGKSAGLSACTMVVPSLSQGKCVAE